VTLHPPSNTITFEAALRDLESRNDKARARAAHALGDVVAPADRVRAVTALVRVLDDKNPDTRAAAALSLGELEMEAAVEPLVERLKDPVPVVRQSSAIALGRLGFRAAFDSLVEALRDGPPDVRFQAATSLAEIDPERAYETLVSALPEEEDGEVLGAIALALGAIGNREAAVHLDGLLARDDMGALREETRFDTAYALAALGGSAARPVLCRFLTHAHLAWDAIEGLEKLGEPAAVEALAPLLDLKRLVLQTKLRAAAAILRLSPQHAAAGRARDALLEGLNARKMLDGGLAVQLLGQVGSAWAVEPLRTARRTRRGRRFTDEIEDSLREIAAREERTT